jgi:hypothetical protein
MRGNVARQGYIILVRFNIEEDVTQPRYPQFERLSLCDRTIQL